MSLQILNHHQNQTCKYTCMCELIANICSVRSAVRHTCRAACNQLLCQVVNIAKYNNFKHPQMHYT